MTVRSVSILLVMLRCACLLSFFPTHLRAELLFERVPISTVDEHYRWSTWPCVERLQDGRLFCVFSVHLKKAAATKLAVVGTFSSDHGRSWSKPAVLIDSDPELDYDPNIVVIGPRVLVTATTTPPSHDKVLTTTRTVAIRSDDNAKSWSSPYEIPMGRNFTAGKISQGIVLRDGAVLFGYAWDTQLETEVALTNESQVDEYAAAMISLDDGRTWTSGKGATVKKRKDPTRRFAVNGLCEPALVELSDGSVYLLGRTGHESLYECRSRDGGRSWSTPVASPLTGHNAPAVLCRFERVEGKKSGILVVWNNSPRNRWPLCVAATFDDCRTWTRPREIAGVKGFQSSYPGCVQASDGTLVVTYHQQRPQGVFEILSVRFDVEWLLAEGTERDS